jgi:hypothetical protein
VNEDTVRRIEAALEERKRQRRKATSTKDDSYPDDRRGPIAGRRDMDTPTPNTTSGRSALN